MNRNEAKRGATVNGRCATRFEIIHPELGLLDTERTREAAFRLAASWSKRNTGRPDFLEEVRVFDSMARLNGECLWATQNGKRWYPVEWKTSLET